MECVCVCVSSFDARFRSRLWDAAGSLDVQCLERACSVSPQVCEESWVLSGPGSLSCFAQAGCLSSPQANLPFEEQRRHVQLLVGAGVLGAGREDPAELAMGPVWGSSRAQGLRALGWKVGAQADLANLPAWLWGIPGRDRRLLFLLPGYSWERSLGHLLLPDLGTEALAGGWHSLLSACLKERQRRVSDYL